MVKNPGSTVPLMIKHPFNISKIENIKTSNPIGVGVSGIFYRKYHKGSGRAKTH